MSDSKLNATIAEIRFQAAAWHCHDVCFVKEDLRGENDTKFGKYFELPEASRASNRKIWMKMETPGTDDSPDEEDAVRESGFRFLAFDVTDGSLWHQDVASTSEIADFVEKYNHGLEMEEEMLLKNLDNIVSGKLPNIVWRFAIKPVMERKALLPSKTLGFLSFHVKLGRKKDVPFNFKFDLTRTDGHRMGTELAFQHLIQPFYMISQLLLESRERLYKIIERKDKELEDTKTHTKGVRSSVASVPFDRQEFEKSLTEEWKPVDLQNCDKVPKVMELYKDISSKRLQGALTKRPNKKTKPDASFSDDRDTTMISAGEDASMDSSDVSNDAEVDLEGTEVSASLSSLQTREVENGQKSRDAAAERPNPHHVTQKKKRGLL